MFSFIVVPVFSQAEEPGVSDEQRKQDLDQWEKRLKSLKKSRANEDRIVSLSSRILNADPKNQTALLQLGVYYLQTGRSRLAKIIFNRALKHYPKNSSVYNNMGLILLKEGKTKEAVRSFQKSLQYDSNNYFAAGNLGTLYLQAYNYEGALEHLDLAYSETKEKLSNQNSQAVKTGNNYAVALAWAGKQKKSERVFKELMESNPKALEVIMNYALLLGRTLQNKKKAYGVLKKLEFLDSSGLYSRKIKTLKKYLKSIE